MRPSQDAAGISRQNQKLARLLRAGASLAAVLPTAVSAAPYCQPGQQFFQDPSAPVERINGQNLQRCSSELTCINQVYASVMRQQLRPAAYQWRKQGRGACLEPIATPQVPDPGQAALNSELSDTPSAGQPASPNTSPASQATAQDP